MTHLRSAPLLPLLIMLVLSGLAAGCGDSGGESTSTTSTAGNTSESTTQEEAPLQVQPGVGIGGVEIGDKRASVEETLGKPEDESTDKSEATGMPNTLLTYEEGTLTVSLMPDVIQVDTIDAEVRTPEGIGVDSTQAEVKQAYPDVVCIEGVCTVGPLEAGKISTTYFVKDGAVERVSVGRLVE